MGSCQFSEFVQQGLDFGVSMGKPRVGYGYHCSGFVPLATSCPVLDWMDGQVRAGDGWFT